MAEFPGAAENRTALACVADAIPAAERAAHFDLIKELFRSSALDRRDLVNGMSFSFDEKHVDAVARFVANERRCCPFLRFELTIAPPGHRVMLVLSGPDGTREFLSLELLGAHG